MEWTQHTHQQSAESLSREIQAQRDNWVTHHGQVSELNWGKNPHGYIIDPVDQ